MITPILSYLGQPPKELTADFFTVAKPAGTRGPGRKPAKQSVTLRLDPDMLERYRSTGKGWQGRINADLRKAVKLKPTGTAA